MANTMNHVVIGESSSSTYYLFDNTSIISLEGDISIDLVGKEMPIDVLTVEVNYQVIEPEVFAPSDDDKMTGADDNDFYGYYNNDIRKIPYGTPLTYSHGTGQGYEGELVGKFYVKNVERTQKNKYTINAMSPIGLMDKQTHYGNLYSGAKFSDILDEIIGDLFEYAVNDDLKDLTLTGWLPCDTKRNNLYRLLLAYNVSMIKRDDGVPYFTWLAQSDPTEISSSNIYIDGSYDYGSPATSVEVTEHSYLYSSSTDEEVIFDNGGDSGTVENQLVTYTTSDEYPIYPDSVHGDGLTVISASYNYAVVTGRGQLYGIPYIHATKVYAMDNEEATPDQEENVVSITDDTLIAVANSNFIASRLLNYYANAQTITNAIVFNNQKCGRYYTFEDPFRDIAKAYLSKISFNVSSNIKADCTFIANYIPTSQGNIYTHYVILTGSGTWTIPDAILAEESPSFRVIMIGGGDGGDGGENGSDGSDGTAKDNIGAGEDFAVHASGGAGGSGGSAGTPGRIRTIDFGSSQFPIYSGHTYAYVCGSGGTGGAGGEDAGEGTAGADTSFSPSDGSIIYNTSTQQGGASSDTGISNYFTGDVYAYKGDDGVDGGHGANYSEDDNIITVAESVAYNGTTYPGGDNGADTGWFCYYSGDDFIYYYGYYARGGSGGGAAVGSSPGTGEDGSYYDFEVVSSGNHCTETIGGKAGVGATAMNRTAETVYGVGGSGGHGGGGGGQGGDAFNRDQGAFDLWNNPGAGGAGGAGGNGAKGGDGCIIIYW